ncbi:MAG: divalent-cation tolerance protein CutA [Kordiimonadaceae bacterium]|nr:divalent-cation tolerance protein CutA [Kordiimonadaceae bacterium]
MSETTSTGWDTGCVTVYVTTESEDIAVHMATKLVKDRLVACVNVQTGVRSLYEWDGVIQLNNEVSLHMKTTTDKVEQLIAAVKEMHSYDVPCITVSPITDGNADYMDWVKKQVA